MKKLIFVFSIAIPAFCSAQFDISLIGEDTLCIGQSSQYSVEINEFQNQYLFRDTTGLISGGNGYKALDAGYHFLDVTNTFTYDLWVKPTRTINMKGESNVCAGGVSVPLAHSNQNWALVPVGLGEGRMSVGLTIGTNGVMVGEHSGNILVSRLSYTTAINDWVHVAIVYRTDSIFLYLNGELVRSRSIHCPSNTKCVTSGLTGYYYGPDFTGNIDEFRLWDIALNGEQIQNIKDKKLRDDVNGLRYYASFDNGKFERTSGDLGTIQMTVNQIEPEKYIKKSSWQLNSFSGTNVNSLTPYSAGDITYSWSTGDNTQNTTFTLIDEFDVIRVEVNNGNFNQEDSIFVRGIDCCQGIIYDTIITEVFDTTYIEMYDTIGSGNVLFFQSIEKEEKTFPTSIEVAGKLAVVSAGWETTSVATKAGAIYIYEFEGDEWIEKQRLISPVGKYDGIYGHNVATDGKTIIVTEPNAEKVHVYSRGTDLWELDTTFTFTDNSSEKFGISAAIDGNTFVVGSGAVFATLCNAVGSVYVFEKSGDSWSNTEILVAAGASSHNNFGADVSIDNDVIAVGADNDECYAGEEGYVCIFEKEGNSWNEVQKIMAPDGSPGNRFGKSVDIENDRLIINGHGGSIESAYYYEKENEWTFKYQFKNADDPVNYGWPVCLNEDLVIIGAHHDSELIESNGAIYIYQGSGSDFQQIAKIFPENPVPQTKFAYGNLYSDGNFLFANGGYHQARVEIFQLSQKYFEFIDTVRREVFDTTYVTIFDTIKVKEDILNARYLKFESYYSEDNSQVNVYDISAWSEGTNVARNKATEVSSCEGGGDSNCGSSAVDDNDFSRWSSDRHAEGPNNEFPHYIVVDLEEEYDLDSLRLNIEGFDSWNQDFSFTYSSDSIDWLTIGNGLDTTGIFTYYSSGGTAKTYYDTVRVVVHDTIRETYVDTVSEFYQEGLISHYPFDGDARDLGTRKKDGIVKGAVLTTDRKGKENSAYYFDGVDDWIEIPGELAITNTFSIAFWAKSENRSGTSNIICDGSSGAGGNDFLLNFRGNDIGIRADKSGGQLNLEYSSPVSLQNLELVNEWVHVVWVMRSDGSKIYVNGVEKAEIDIPGSNKDYHDEFSYIGARNVWDRCDNFFKGKLDDIRIYNLALRGPQVMGIYDEKNVEIDTVATIYERVSVTDTLIIDAVLTGYEEPFNVNTIKVYPNPAKDHLFINTGNYTQMKGYRLNIINQLGISVFETMVNEPLYQINLSTWTGKGLYFMQIIDRKGKIIDIRKIILQ